LYKILIMSDRFIDRELNNAEKELLVEKYKTALKKTQYINEIRSGLGESIKKNPNGVKIIKTPWYKKIGNIIKNFFTKL
jgi:hypothetical protein